jgi:Tfp pilus assembly protein FimT
MTEMLLVLGIMSIMLTLGLGNLLGSQRKSQMNSTVNGLVSELRETE